MNSTRKIGLFFAAIIISLGIFASPRAAEVADIRVYFSPNGGCTEAIIEEIKNAKAEILVQAYSFTSAPIAKSLVDAHKRGDKVSAIIRPYRQDR